MVNLIPSVRITFLSFPCRSIFIIYLIIILHTYHHCRSDCCNYWQGTDIRTIGLGPGTRTRGTKRDPTDANLDQQRVNVNHYCTHIHRFIPFKSGNKHRIHSFDHPIHQRSIIRANPSPDFPHLTVATPFASHTTYAFTPTHSYLKDGDNDYRCGSPFADLWVIS